MVTGAMQQPPRQAEALHGLAVLTSKRLSLGRAGRSAAAPARARRHRRCGGGPQRARDGPREHQATGAHTPLLSVT